MFKLFNFKKEKIKRIQANTLYDIACDIFKEQEKTMTSPEIPYFIKANNYVRDCIKNGLLEQKFNLLCGKKENKNA